MEQIVVKYSPRGASLRERSIAAAAACANSSGCDSLASSIVSVTRSEADRAGISEREPPPFARLFASFGTRGGLLLVVPAAVLFIVVLVTTTLWDGEVRTWTTISLPNAYFQAVTHAVVAWTLHKVNRPGGAYEVISETGLNHKWARRVRLALGGILVVIAVYSAYFLTLTFANIDALVTHDELITDDVVVLGIGVVIPAEWVDRDGWVATIQATIVLVVVCYAVDLMTCFQILVVVACVARELKDLKALVHSCDAQFWNQAVVPAAKHVAKRTMPTLARGWTPGMSMATAWLVYHVLLDGVKLGLHSDWRVIVNLTLSVVVLLCLLLMPLRIERGCKEVEKALASRALDALETSPAAAEPAMALREVLTTGPNWGWPVAGVHVTKRLLIRGAGVAVTLWTLMGGALGDVSGVESGE